MEQRSLPNGVLIIVLGIFGYLCCCIVGLGIIPAAIAFYLANEAQKMYALNPETYTNINQIKTGKIIASIALILNILMILYVIYTISSVGWEAWSDEFMRRWNEGMERGGQY